MSRTRKLLIGLLLITVMLLGIGYATIQNVTLNISGTASSDPSQSNFIVRFTGTPEVSNSSKVTAEVTNDTNATINVEGLTSSGETVTAIYTIENPSSDLSADLTIETTNSNEEYFDINAKLAKTSIVAGNTTILTVTIELLKTPISGEETSTIEIELTATPVQPGEEGSTNGNGGNGGLGISQTLNEYGFYYGVPYSTASYGQVMSIVAFDDGSGGIFINRILDEWYPAGTFIYSYKNVALGNEVVEVSEDGTELVTPIGKIVAEEGITIAKCGIWGHSEEDGLEHIADENCPVGHYACEHRCGTWEIPTNGTYVMATPVEGEKTTYTEGEKLPECYISREGDIFYCGDYEYHIAQTYNSSKSVWESAGINEWVARVLDNTKTEYGEICSSINGDKVALIGTFEDCTSLVTAPEIPEGIVNLVETFNGCTELKNVPVIPDSTINMIETFAECTSLTSVPEIPYGTINMTEAFAACESLMTAPKIPESVMSLYYTFVECPLLISAPEIPSRVTDMAYTFAGCINLKTYAGSNDANGDFSNYTIPTGVVDMQVTFAACELMTVSPQIPITVTNMKGTFAECIALVSAPVIPENVSEMSGTFAGCTSLTGTIQINTDKIYNNDSSSSTANNGYQCFYETTKPIVLKGTGNNQTTLQILAGTANNGNITIE